MTAARDAIDTLFGGDLWQAHATLFAHRHPDESAPAHVRLVQAINRPVPRLQAEGFRGFGKSTYLEETAILKAVAGDFHNMVVLGSSYSRACDRLGAIKRELEINRDIADLFGRQQGPVWQEGRIVLANGVCIQALGREQSMLGIKYLDWRPDAALVDDVEDPDEVRTDAERAQTWDWFIKTFLPSLDHPLYSWVRALGTRRGSNSLPERLQKAGWPTVKFPVEFTDKSGERRATWPSKFPLPVIDEMKETYRGDMDTWAQEFMCQATSERARIFRREMFRVEPRVRVWEAVYAFVDPARTRGRESATTGWAAWSWVRNRLVVWGADALFLAPDEIVALIFDIAERFDPVWLGAELDGLEQWLMQPIRQEQMKRGVVVPVKGVRAITGTRGGGQTRFIEGLQPLASSGEIVLAQELPALVDQFVSFPHGRRDAANALAYAQTMKPGALVYDGFNNGHIVDDLGILPGRPLFLAANATGALTTAVLVQALDGTLRILADWAMEGSPSERAADIHEAAQLFGDSSHMVEIAPRARGWEDMLKAVTPTELVRRTIDPVWVVPKPHAERYTNVGLVQAVRRLPAETRLGGEAERGQAHLRDLMGRTVRGLPAIEIGSAASWTLRALSGGYSRMMVRGHLADEPEHGPYRVLMEGLEAFCGMIAANVRDDEAGDDGQNMRYDERTGRRYVSALPQRRG